MKGIRRLVASGLVSLLSFSFPAIAQDIPVVADLSSLEEHVGETWTNNSMAKLFPPNTDFELKAGGIAFKNTFETGLVANLIAVTNDTVVFYPVSVIETNLLTRERIYFNANDIAVHTSTVSLVDYPEDWIEDTYGEPPAYLIGDELVAWYVARDPSRCTLTLELVSTSDVQAYVEMMTNAVSSISSTQTWEDLLILYSNDIAAVGMLEAGGSMGVYVHAPTNVTMLDVFRSEDLTNNNAWSHQALIAHTFDPSLFIDTSGHSQATYTVADALADEDGDSLSSGREYFIYGTSTTTNDTDGDGLNDFLELMVYSTDANNSDSDDDGVLDGEEVLIHNLNPTSNDTDGDWVSDGYELAHGSSPTDATDHVTLLMVINQGDLYADSTNIYLAIPGLAAQSVEVIEELYTGNVHSTEIVLSDAMPFSLSFTDGAWRSLTAIPRRNQGLEEGNPIYGSLYLDLIPPTLSVTSPTNGLTTSDAWINIEGLIADTNAVLESSVYTNIVTGPVTVTINGKRANRRTDGGFVYDRYGLEPGTNRLEVIVTDVAGNGVTQVLEVIQDTSGDLIAPTATLNLPYDYTVTGGVTNWSTTTTTVGSNETLLVDGTVDDETASIELAVINDGLEIGTFTAQLQGDHFLGQVFLAQGTNTLSVHATDAAGNTSTTSRTVIRDISFFFDISSPLPDTVLNSRSTTVHAVLSLSFAGATVTINGVGTTASNQSDRITFTTTEPVQFTDNCSDITAEAKLNGKSYYAKGKACLYEITAFNTSDNTTLFQDFGAIPGWVWSLDIDRITEKWSTANLIHRTTTYTYDGDLLGGFSTSQTTTNLETSVPAGSITFGDRKDEETLPYIEKYVGKWNGDLTFVRHGLEEEPVLVILQFPGLNYGRKPGDPIDPSAVTFWNEPGFAYNGNIGFLVEIENGIEYTVTQGDFTWPKYDYPVDVGGTTGTYAGHWLSIGRDVDNGGVKVLLSFRSADGDKLSPSNSMYFFNGDKRLGKIDPNPTDAVYWSNNMEIVGAVNMAIDDLVSYDFKRTVNHVVTVDGVEVIPGSPNFPDDQHNSDEQLIPSDGLIYSIDGPTLKMRVGDSVVYKASFLEWVEMKYDGNTYRVSKKLPWHSVISIRRIAGTFEYERDDNGENVIGEGPIEVR